MLKWAGIIVLLIVVIAAANGARYIWVNTAPDLVSPDGKHTVLDGMTGKLAVDKYLEIKEQKTEFNLPTIRTGVMMYQAQNGRYPKSLEEVVQSGELSPDIIRDNNGVVFQLKIMQNQIILNGAGSDKIHSTTDDVQYVLK
ncbi:MAG: hypothetical protein P9L94_13385 [Candidatus Hinthialibacter antarcticus]|nr:hypothetical protein [Candidatus Hinthialibacter antarcticus]